jgi:hypothetical protein
MQNGKFPVKIYTVHAKVAYSCTDDVHIWNTGAR